MSSLLNPNLWAQVFNYRQSFINGLITTLKTASLGLLIAFILGIIFGLMSTSGKKPLKAIARVYVEIIQNTPLLLQVCFLFYILAFSGNGIGVIPTGIIALGVYTGAYMSEVVRAGITSIPKGQFEAAHSQGFNYLETMYYIIIPQSIKIILPPMVNQVVNLIKNTSCLYIIGGADLISTTYNFVTNEKTGGAYAPAYIVSAVLFFIICFPLSTLAGKWEQKLKNRETSGSLHINEKANIILTSEDIKNAHISDTAKENAERRP